MDSGGDTRGAVGSPAPSADAALRGIYDEAYYRANCNAPHWFLNNHAKEDARWKAVLKMLAPQPGDTILDLGCASGERTVRIAGHCAQAIGVDYSPAGVALARKRARAGGVANVRFIEADVRNLTGIADASVDKAMAVDLVEHIADDTLAAMLRELARVMRGGGVLAIYTPCRTHYVERLKAHNFILRQEEGHIAVRRPEALRQRLVAAGWKIGDEFYLPSSYPVFCWAERALSRLPLVAPFVRFRICVAAIRP